jgi:hypothetical protein
MGFFSIRIAWFTCKTLYFLPLSGGLRILLSPFTYPLETRSRNGMEGETWSFHP